MLRNILELSHLPLRQLVFTTKRFGRQIQDLRLPLHPLLQGLQTEGLQDVSLQHLGVGSQQLLQLLHCHCSFGLKESSPVHNEAGS